MKTLSHDTIPFFVFSTHPFLIYIIDNKILGFDCVYRPSYGHEKAFLLLTELMQSEQASALLPAVFQQLFKGKNYSLDKKEFKLFGYEEKQPYGIIDCVRCFDLDISIVPTQDKPVVFQDMSFEGFPLEKELALSFEEAAMILANISSIPYLSFFGSRLIPLKTKEQLDAQLSFPHEGWQPPLIANKTPFNMAYNKFTIYYFKYLEKLLLEKQITPKQLLNYNGLLPLALLLEIPPVFTFLKEVMATLLDSSTVPLPQLILYYAFFDCAYDNMRFMTDIQKATLLLDYHQKNEELLKRLREKLYVLLPQREGYWELLMRLS